MLPGETLALSFKKSGARSGGRKKKATQQQQITQNLFQISAYAIGKP